MTETFITPVGRIVSGSPSTYTDTDFKGQPLVYKSGAKAGQPAKQWYMGLAVPKTDQSINELFGLYTQVARAGYPQFFDAAGNCTHPKFSWKFIDGDSQVPDVKGIRPCDREGYAGNWIFKFRNYNSAPRCYTKGGEQTITNPEEHIKCGYWVRVSGRVEASKDMTNPGLFVNHDMVEMLYYGQEIQSGPDPKAAFGGANLSMPAGASATPLTTTPGLAHQPGMPAATPQPGMPAATPQPGMPAATPQPGMPAATPQPGMPAATPQPGVPGVQPAHDFLNPQSNAVPAPQQKIEYEVAGKRYGEEELRKAGYTEVHLASLPKYVDGVSADQTPF